MQKLLEILTIAGIASNDGQKKMTLKNTDISLQIAREFPRESDLRDRIRQHSVKRLKFGWLSMQLKDYRGKPVKGGLVIMRSMMEWQGRLLWY